MKENYKTPTLILLGNIIKNTHGQNGSTIDGNQTLTQTGGGNDK